MKERKCSKCGSADVYMNVGNTWQEHGVVIQTVGENRFDDLFQTNAFLCLDCRNLDIEVLHWEWPVTGASNRQVCFKGTLKIPTLPASDLVVAQPYYAGSGIRTRLKVTSGGNLKVESHAGTASQLSTNTYTASTVVKVEVRVFNNNSAFVLFAGDWTMWIKRR